jgi:tetratricopeptide (TPR) repeat protein
LLRQAAHASVPTSRDYLLFYGFSDVFYEGNFRRSEMTFYPFHLKYPSNPRFSLPLALVAPYDPFEGLLADRYWRILAQEWELTRSRSTAPGPWWQGQVRWSVTLALRIRLMSAFQWEALGRPDMAFPIYQEMSGDPLTRYLRLNGPIHMGLARSAWLQGSRDTALGALEEVIQSDKLEPWHDAAEDFRDLIREAEQKPAGLELWTEAGATLIDVLETRKDPGAAWEDPAGGGFPFPRSHLPSIESLAAEGESRDPVLLKLLADCYTLSGLFERGLEAYGRALRTAGDNQAYWAVHMQCHLSRAFILERLGRIKEAAKEAEQALELVARPDLIRYSLESRLDGAKRAADR